MRRVIVLLLLLAMLTWAVAGAAVAAPNVLLDAMRHAHAEDAVYRNALYLYLRMAGVAWIAVEWMAAVILWRAYRVVKARTEGA
ncbi:MAG: hypothetical protein ACLFTT_18500 [Candidatus Hydrogenedentota bacterium]